MFQNIVAKYEMGSEISTMGHDIVLLKMLTQKWPTDEEFNDGFTLRKYVEVSLSPIEDILHLNLTSEIWDQLVDHIPNLQEYKNFMPKDICALRLFKFGILCSAES